MKKVLLLVVMVALCSGVLAEDVSQQNLDFQTNKATFAVLKQPSTDTSKQKVVVKDNWFSFVVVINGKTPFDKTDNISR